MHGKRLHEDGQTLILAIDKTILESSHGQRLVPRLSELRLRTAAKGGEDVVFTQPSDHSSACSK